MAIKLVQSEWAVERQGKINTFMCDSDADFTDLPESFPMSQALSPSGNMKIVNASGAWVDFCPVS